MTTLRNLNRAVQSAEFPSHEWAQAVREWIDKATAKMEWEPASEGAKVECPNCKQPGTPHYFWRNGRTSPDAPTFTCEPAVPVGEMPDALDTACDLLEWGGNVNAAAALRDAWRTHAAQPKVADMYGYIKCELDDLLGSCGAIVALEGVPLHWKFAAEIRDKAKALAAKVEIADVSRRTGFSPPAAQPKVAMTEELERCLSTLHILAGEMGTNVGAGVRADIAAVRSQAAGVKLPKVRALIEEVSSDRYDGKQYRHLLTAALAELDAAEGKAETKEGK